jgi:hypothetical protein
MTIIVADQQHPRRKRDRAPAITGLAVTLPTPCSRCGACAATIAADHVLECGCGMRRNPLSKATIGFVTEVVGCFGTPVGPIVLRRGGPRNRNF